MRTFRGLQNFKGVDYGVAHVVCKQDLTLPDGRVVPVGGTVDPAALTFRKFLTLFNRGYLRHPSVLAAYENRRDAQGGAPATLSEHGTVMRQLEREGGVDAPPADGDGEEQLDTVVTLDPATTVNTKAVSSKHTKGRK